MRSGVANTKEPAKRISDSLKGSVIHYCSHKSNLDLAGRKTLEMLLKANKRLQTAYLLKESFGQLWDYSNPTWARKSFDNWKAQFCWQRLSSFEKFANLIEKHWDGIISYCHPDHKVSLGFMEGLNNKIRLIQHRAYGIKDQEYLMLKVITSFIREQKAV